MLAELVEDVLDPRRLLLVEAAGAERLLEVGDRSVADLLPGREGLAHPACRRRRGCGRWCSGRGSSGRARRSGGRGARSPAARTSRAAGRGSRARASARGAASSGRASGYGAAAPRAGPGSSAAARRRCSGSAVALAGEDIVGRCPPPADAAQNRDRHRRRRRHRGPSTAGSPGDGPPAVFVHGVPTHSEDWHAVPRGDGGPRDRLRPARVRPLRPPRPSTRFDYTIVVLRRRSSADCARAPSGSATTRLCVHDWGGVGLIAAQRAPGPGPPPRRHERRAAAARLPLAPDRSDLADPGARRALDPDLDPPPRRIRAARVQGRPQPPRPRVRRHGLRTTSTAGRSTRSSASTARRDPEELARAGERLGEHRLPRAGRLGGAGPLHLPRGSGGPTRRLCRTPSWSSSRRPGTGPGGTSPR